MGVGEKFETFCANLTVNNCDIISARCNQLTKRLNIDFWGSDSDSNHSLYVGSYGRGTAIRGFSDLDILFELPDYLYARYNSYQGNGQSALLQAVRDSLRRTYPNTYIAGDGQVVAVEFSEGMSFEVVPAFLNTADTYTYPDSNKGGAWKTTDPKPEIAEIAAMDSQCNFNLKRLCRMARAWKAEWDVPMGGLLVDTLAHGFLKNWQNRQYSYLFYDWMSRDFFEYLANQEPQQIYWLAVGSGNYIWRKGPFEYKAKQCYNLACQAIEYEGKGYTALAREKWKDIYGKPYP